MDQPIEVTRRDAATVQLRQPKSSHWEAPFVYLLLGRERALLLDTGGSEDAVRFPLRETVDALIVEWLGEHPHEPYGLGEHPHEPYGLGEHPHEPYGLVVAHTHSHEDHLAADVQFIGRPDTVVVGAETSSVIDFFGLDAWPDSRNTIDLGGRTLDVIAGPGHEASAVVFFDRGTGIMFTGDTVYPGRLYVEDRAAYAATIDRLIAFRDEQDADGTPVTVLLGGHIEMTTTPGVDYPVSAVDQPHEAPLELPPSILDEIRDAVAGAPPGPGRVVRDRFIVHNEV